jgi:membrane-bound lytic murein transglycosylase D
MIRVSVAALTGECQTYTFTAPFKIGRVPECEVFVNDEHVSRNHAQVLFENGQWFVQDLRSANGLFIGDQRLERISVGNGTTFRLGVKGPFVTLETAHEPFKAADPSVTGYIQRYFQETPGETVGDHTVMVRRAFQQVQKKQRSKYVAIVAVLGVALLAAGAYAFYISREARKQKALAQDIFYSMKSLDVDIAGLEKLLLDSNNTSAVAEVRKYQDRRKDLAQSYDRFLTSLHVYDPRMTEQDRLIMRVARIFGECEIAMPPDFSAEVKEYIKKWQGSPRMRKAIALANEKGYPKAISTQFLSQDLPPQFFYLALQESDFDAYNSGPPTRLGIAKGMWQFIPRTAVKYGLKVGPLADLRRPDPGDDRHDYVKATAAAAHYIKDLYTTDAQASGLLVMACYNWGEDYVLPLVRSMPANPRDRNFWRLLAVYKDKLPKETYDYVFYIFSAAVIGENPKLFGFDFESPLAHLDQR